MTVEVQITPIPIQGLIGCCVPVLPGTPDVDAPLEDRTERCAVDAHWVFGAIPTCDIHAKVVCESVEWDWDGVWQEAGRDPASVAVPWEARQRHSQEDTEKTREHFVVNAGA